MSTQRLPREWVTPLYSRNGVIRRGRTRFHVVRRRADGTRFIRTGSYRDYDLNADNEYLIVLEDSVALA